MYMFQVSGIISLMDNDCKSSGHGTLSEQESRARQLFFAHVFLDVLFSFPLFALLNSAIHVDVVFMLFTLQSCEKLIHIKNET